jgi:hypothetical protein
MPPGWEPVKLEDPSSNSAGTLGIVGLLDLQKNHSFMILVNHFRLIIYFGLE